MAERTTTKRYRLIDLRTGQVWDYDSADAIVDTMFVLTMWPPHAVVFKDGVRYRKRLSGETGELARALARWHPHPKVRA